MCACIYFSGSWRDGRDDDADDMDDLRALAAWDRASEADRLAHQD